MKHDFVWPSIALVIACAAGTVLLKAEDADAQAVQYSAMPSCGAGVPLVYDPVSLTFNCGTSVILAGQIVLQGDVIGTGGPTIVDSFNTIDPGKVIANASTSIAAPHAQLLVGGVALQWSSNVVVQTGTYMVSPGFPWLDRLTTLDSVASVIQGPTASSPGFAVEVQITGTIAGAGSPVTRDVTSCASVSVGTLWTQATCDAQFTASITGTSMIVTVIGKGNLDAHQMIVSGAADNTEIIQAVSIDGGGLGTYEISPSQTVTSRSMVSHQGLDTADVLTAIVISVSGTPEVAGVRFNITHPVQ